jgi:two-component system chemotaxis sensor kinase CheA
VDDLIDDFIAETREMLDALSGEIVAWEADPADRARLDSIFRFVHTVKGNCGFFDLPRIRALSHAAEDSLADVRSGARTPDRRLVSAVLAVLDRIGDLVAALDANEQPATGDDASLIEALASDAGVEAAVEPAAPRSKAGSARTVRLPVDLLDEMMSGVSDLVLARNELARHLRSKGSGADVEAAFERVSATIGELRDAVTRTRMQRIEGLFSSLPRLVRDLSAETGKEVALVVEGGDVEIDREMVEMIRDPLTHILRNAVDHGIEAAADRRRAGKPETGLLRVEARQAGNQILVEICDDGRGIDGDRLVSKAVSAGLITAVRAAALGESEKNALIFEAGLSTAREVTGISGRGVGMDVVRANIERIGGVVEVDSRRGEGVRFTLRVPLTLTIIPALTVGAGGQTFAIPRSAIEEIVRVKGGQARVETVGGASFVTVRERRLPLVFLSDALGQGRGDPSDTMLILLKPAGAELYALAVDALHDHEELVVKPASPLVTAAGLYAGTTIADDGRPVLLLDPSGVAAKAGRRLQRSTALQHLAPATSTTEVPKALLFRSVGGGNRLVPLAAVERIEDVAPGAVAESGGRLHVALDGRIFELKGCAADGPRSPSRLLRLSDGSSEIAYAIAEVLEILPMPDRLVDSPTPGEVLGLALVGDEQVEVLDLHWLFAEQPHLVGEPLEAPICVMPAGDNYMDAILRPLVEAAGYRVLATGAPGSEHAAIIVQRAEEPDQSPLPSAAHILRIRSPREPLAGDDRSIHRYDREGLLSALRIASGVPHHG